MKTFAKFSIAVPLLLALFIAPCLPLAYGASAPDPRAAYERYLSDYDALKRAIDSGADEKTIKELSERYAESLRIYKDSSGVTYDMSGAVDPATVSASAGSGFDGVASDPKLAAGNAKIDGQGAPAASAAAIEELKRKIAATADPAAKAALQTDLAFAILAYSNDSAAAAKLLTDAIASVRAAGSAANSAKLLERVAALQKALRLREDVGVKYAAMIAKQKAADQTSWIAFPVKLARKAEAAAATYAYNSAVSKYRRAIGLGGPSIPFLSSPADPALYAAPSKIVFILLDGVRQDIFKKLLDQGKLPNIKKLADSGVLVQNGVSVLPSTTGPAYAPFVMGVGPAKSKLSGIRLFDRATGTYRVYCGTDNGKINSDASAKFPTIYEILSDKATLAVFGMVDRGVRKSGVPWFQVAYNKVTKDYNDMDSALVDRFIRDMKDGVPVFSFISLHSPDSNGHSYGAGDEYTKAVIFEDALVGRIVRHVESLGETGRVSFVISSDHGLASTDKKFDVDAALANDLKMSAYHSIPRNTIDFNLFKSRFKNDIITAVSGNACVLVYAKKPGSSSFAARPTEAELRAYPDRERRNRVDLIEYFAGRPGIGRVLYRGNPGEYHAETANGHALVKKGAGGFSYSVARGEDPFGYAASPAAKLCDGAFHSAAEWLAATGPLDDPYAPALVADLLDSDCGGDIVLLAATGYEPWNEGQRGVHGNLTYDQIKVPIIMSGPAFKPGTVIGSARTVDLFPTMLRALGRDIPAGIDGETLTGALK